MVVNIIYNIIYNISRTGTVVNKYSTSREDIILCFVYRF